MTIGVDAGPLSIRDDRLKVGVHRTVFGLVSALSRNDRGNDYRLYGFLPIPTDTMQGFGPRVRNVVLSPAAGYMTVRLPLELLFRPVDVFLGASQALPWAPGPRKVAIAYDCGFVHEPAAYGASARSLARQTASMTRRADAVVAISNSTKRDLTDLYGYPTERISVAYPGVDERFTPKGRKHAEPAPYFLVVGSVRAGKNLAAAVRAFVRFRKRYAKRYRLVIVGGDYWPDGAVAHEIAASGMEADIVRKGFIADDLLPEYYRGATALIVPSLWEGFCLPAAEAMASGVPVVASDRGALPEIVGDAGYIARPDDTDAFADAMRSLATSSSLTTRLGAVAVRRAKKFSWDSFAMTVLSVMAGKAVR